MKDFDDFYIQLIEDQVWFENASLHHKPETFESVARKVWTLGLADFEAFKSCPMREHRMHVYNKVSKLPHDKPKVDWVAKALQEQEAEKKAKQEKEEPPLVRGSEQYLKRTQEFLDALRACEEPKRVAPVSAKERMDAENLRPKPFDIREPSQEEKIRAAQNHLAMALKARTKMFREKYPDGTVKELQKYLKQFKNIDNPFNL